MIIWSVNFQNLTKGLQSLSPWFEYLQRPLTPTSIFMPIDKLNLKFIALYFLCRWQNTLYLRPWETRLTGIRAANKIFCKIQCFFRKNLFRLLNIFSKRHTKSLTSNRGSSGLVYCSKASLQFLLEILVTMRH